MGRSVTALALLGGVLFGCKGSEKPGSDPLLDSDGGGDYGNFDPEHMVQIELTMNPDDWDSLRYESQNFVTALGGDCMDEPVGRDYTEFEAAITMDGESLDLIRVRKKGLIGSQSTEKPSMSINLDEYVDGAELFGTDNLVLNNGVQDPSLMRQCLTYDLFRQAGLAASRCNFARVSMNDELLGIYVHVEPVKPAMLRDHFGDDSGDLYEGGLSDFREGWVDTFDPDTDETDTEFGEIYNLIDALDSDENLFDALEPHLDIDQFMSFWAMETITGHWDSYTGNKNNFFVYDNPESDTFVFMPWGVDGALQSSSAGQGPDTWVPVSSTLAVRFLNDDEGAAMFEERVFSLLDQMWDEEAILSEADRMEDLLATEIDIDDEMADGIEDVRDYINGRREGLERAFPASPGYLYDPYCLAEVGSLETDFETTWGSNTTSENWYTEGTMTMDVNWYGDPIEADGGAVSGEDDGYSFVAMLGLIDEADQSYFLPYTVFDTSRLIEGETMDYNDYTQGGYLFYTERNSGFEQIGYMGGGTIEFDSLDLSQGGAIHGSISTYIYNWEEVD